jgi:hypothetical protein
MLFSMMSSEIGSTSTRLNGLGLVSTILAGIWFAPALFG